MNKFFVGLQSMIIFSDPILMFLFFQDKVNYSGPVNFLKIVPIITLTVMVFGISIGLVVLFIKKMDKTTSIQSVIDRNVKGLKVTNKFLKKQTVSINKTTSDLVTKVEVLNSTVSIIQSTVQTLSIDQKTLNTKLDLYQFDTNNRFDSLDRKAHV